jgi:hypothetical protein
MCSRYTKPTLAMQGRHDGVDRLHRSLTRGRQAVRHSSEAGGHLLDLRLRAVHAKGVSA